MEIIKFTEQQRKDYEQLPTGMAIYQTIAGKPKTLLVTDELCRLLRISREDLIANLDKSMFGFVHPDDIGRMAYFGKNFAAHTDEKYDVFFRWKTPKMEDYHIFHSWANHVLVDGVSLGFFFYSDAEESGKNNQILDIHYQKYANDQMYQDRLTNLPNRRFLEIFGMEEVANSHDGKQPGHRNQKGNEAASSKATGENGCEPHFCCAKVAPAYQRRPPSTSASA